MELSNLSVICEVAGSIPPWLLWNFTISNLTLVWSGWFRPWLIISSYQQRRTAKQFSVPAQCCIRVEPFYKRSLLASTIYRYVAGTGLWKNGNLQWIRTPNYHWIPCDRLIHHYYPTPWSNLPALQSPIEKDNRLEDTIWPLWPSTMSKDINGQVVVTDGMPLRRGSLASREGGEGRPPAQPAPALRLRHTSHSASPAHAERPYATNCSFEHKLYIPIQAKV